MSTTWGVNQSDAARSGGEVNLVFVVFAGRHVFGRIECRGGHGSEGGGGGPRWATLSESGGEYVRVQRVFITTHAVVFVTSVAILLLLPRELDGEILFTESRFFVRVAELAISRRAQG